MESKAKKSIKILYDPYSKRILYRWRSQEKGDWEKLGDKSSLSKKTLQRGPLQNHAIEIVNIILDEYCKKGDIDLHFCGTVDDWEDMKRVVEQYGQGRIHCQEKIKGVIEPADKVALEIKEIFKRLDKELKSSGAKEALDQYNDAMRPEIAVCVFGTYSSGKSAFINALIGEEILPSATHEETTRVFEITQKPGDLTNTSIQLTYRGNEVVIGFKAKKGYTLEGVGLEKDNELNQRLSKIDFSGSVSASYIYEVIDMLNHFDDNKSVGDYAIGPLIKLQVPFSQPPGCPLERSSFVIYDTPGSDSVRHQDHLENLKKALRAQTHGLPICITTPETLATTGTDVLLKTFRQLGGALDQSNLLAVVNKADDGDESDFRKEKVVDTPIGKLSGERVLFVSSIMGLGAKKKDMKDCRYGKTRDRFDDSHKRYIGEAPTCQLFRYNILPEREAEKGGHDEYSQLYHNSGLWAVEREIGIYIERFSWYNKCWQAKGYLQEAIKSTEVEIKAAENEQEKSREKILEQSGTQRKKLFQELDSTAQKLEKEAQAGASKLLEEINREYELKETKDGVKERWREYKKSRKREEAQGEMEGWIKGKVQDNLLRWRDAVDSRVNEYWEKQAQHVREVCAKLITESEVLSDKEKRVLEEYIMNHAYTPRVESEYRVEEGVFTADILGWKIPWFDANKCVEDMRTHTNKKKQDLTQTYKKVKEKTFKNWRMELQNGLVNRAADLNPHLNELAKEQKKCERKIKDLKKRAKNLEDGLKSVENLFPNFKGQDK